MTAGIELARFDVDVMADGIDSNIEAHRKHASLGERQNNKTEPFIIVAARLDYPFERSRAKRLGER